MAVFRMDCWGESWDKKCFMGEADGHTAGIGSFDAFVCAAKQLCNDFPGLSFDYEKTTIRIHGELNDYWYERYQNVMFGNQEK